MADVEEFKVSNDPHTREMVLDTLRGAGYRITNQRKIILDIILNNDPSCCKEIYREAVKKDKNIGSATVYRMVNTLEELGLISRKNMYQVDCASCNANCESAGSKDEENPCLGCGGCNVVVSTDDGQRFVLDRSQLSAVLESGLRAKGEIGEKIKVTRVAF